MPDVERFNFSDDPHLSPQGEWIAYDELEALQAKYEEEIERLKTDLDESEDEVLALNKSGWEQRKRADKAEAEVKKLRERLLSDEAIGGMTQAILRDFGIAYADASEPEKFWDHAYAREREAVKRATIATLDEGNPDA